MRVSSAPSPAAGRPAASLGPVTVPVTKGEELELHVDSLAYGGNGVARRDGFVVFVRRGLPGDTVRARVTKVKRSHAEAIALDVLEPGADRVEAPCRHFGTCGGCRFQDLAYEAQVAGEGAAGSRRARASRWPRRLRARADRRGRVGVPLPQQARVLVHGDPGRPRTGLPPGGTLGRGARHHALLADHRPRQRRQGRRSRLGAGRGPARLQPGDRAGLPAPPRVPGGEEHRPGARRARHRTR